MSLKVRVDICKPKPFHHGMGALTAHGRTNSTVESRRATATDTIFPEGLYRAHFDSSVSSKAREVEAGKIKNLHSRVGEFRPGSICTRDYGYRCEIGLFFWSERGK